MKKEDNVAPAIYNLKIDENEGREKLINRLIGVLRGERERKKKTYIHDLLIGETVDWGRKNFWAAHIRRYLGAVKERRENNVRGFFLPSGGPGKKKKKE